MGGPTIDTITDQNFAKFYGPGWYNSSREYSVVIAPNKYLAGKCGLYNQTRDLFLPTSYRGRSEVRKRIKHENLMFVLYHRQEY